MDEKKIHHMFNLVENPIMEFISKFLNEPPDVIFKEEMPTYVESLILLPIPEYKKHKYIRFKLTITKLDNVLENKILLNNLIKYENIKHAIGLIENSIYTVLPSIKAASMINNKPILNINLELDVSKWVFKPVYRSDDFIKYYYYINRLKHINKMKEDDNISISDRNELDIEHSNINHLLNDIVITNEIIENDKKINDLYLSNYCIDINVDELYENQLPKYNPENYDKLPIILDNKYGLNNDLYDEEDEDEENTEEL